MFINLRNVGNYTLMVLGGLTILSGIGTFFGTLDPLLEAWGIEQFAVLFGVMKVIIGVLMLIDPIRLFGALVAVSYYGGAIATHVAFETFDVQFGVVIVVTIALWVGILTKVQGDHQMV